jgi:hypothetical protein
MDYGCRVSAITIENCEHHVNIGIGKRACERNLGTATQPMVERRHESEPSAGQRDKLETTQVPWSYGASYL